FLVALKPGSPPGPAGLPTHATSGERTAIRRPPTWLLSSSQRSLEGHAASDGRTLRKPPLCAHTLCIGKPPIIAVPIDPSSTRLLFIAMPPPRADPVPNA